MSEKEYNISPNRIFTNSERVKYGYYQYMDRLFSRERVFKWHYNSRRKLFSNLHKRLKNKGNKGKVIPIKRVKSITEKEFQKNYIQKGIPVVIEGGAKDWSCVKNWDLDYFKNLYGDEKILLVDHEKIESAYEDITLREVLDNIQNDNNKYYRFYPLLTRHPEHIKDFDYNWILKCRNKIAWNENFQVFIGGENSYTPLHNASANNIFTQAHGTKEWYLYHPYYTMIFDPDPAQNVYRNASYRQGGKVYNPFEPDFKTHPLFEYIDTVHVILEEGDLLYNPPYWWHAVRNLSDSIGVGYRWLSPMQSFKTAPVYFSLDMTVVNPTIWKSNLLAKEDINLIHLAQTGQLEKYLANKTDRSKIV